MTVIFVLYGESRDALDALALASGARLLRNTVRQFDQLADNNDGSHQTPPVLAIGSSGWVGLATTADV